MSDRRNKANNGPVKSPVECCPKPTIDLEYLDCRGKGIGGAKYHVYSVNWDGKKDGKFSKSGTLDGNGKAHIDNVPEIKALEYYFEKDPKPYKPELVPAKTPDRNETVSMLDSIAIWLVDTAKGDFNKEQTIGQITVNALLGLIPVVDQVLDARDLTAGLKAIIDYYMEDEAEQQKHPDELGLDYEKWIWINVFIIAIGCIPIVGSAVKGVLKGVIHYLKKAGKTAGKLSPNQLRKGWEFLVAILNKFGVGNAHKWLSTEFPSKIDSWMAEASGYIRGGLDTIKETADKAVAGVSFFSSAKAAELAERAKDYKKGIDKAKSKVDEMANQVKSWFKEQVQTLTSGAHKSENMGATGTKGRPIHNQREQVAAEAPDFERIPPKKPGPTLDNKTAATFTDGRYSNRQLTRNERFYKYHGIDNRTGKKVTWFTNKKYATEADLRKDLAIHRDWKVKIDQVSEFEVPAGTWVSEGTAASQGVGYPGGGYQAVVTNVPRSWIVNTTPAF